MKNLLKKSLVLMLAMVLVVGTMAIHTNAASSKTVKKQTFTCTTKVIDKRATRVYRGTTNLTFSAGEGYVKFVAPKTKTYYFTFSNIKDKRKYGSYTSISIQTRDKKSPKYSFLTKVSTKGGKSSFLSMTVNGQKNTTSGKVVNRYLKSRTGSIKLKKGQVVYLRMMNSGSKTTAKLVIK